jgi:hypothetical protein
MSLYRRIRLPPELIDLVIDALHDDRATLKICALVCRSWVYASRHHLFSHLRVSPKGLDLIALLSSALCTIGPAVRYLIFEYIDDLPEIICRLPHVKRLTIMNSTMSEFQDFTSPAVVSFLRPLESLTFFKVTFDNPTTFLSLLLSFTQLRSLDWNCLSFETPVSDLDLRSLPSDWDELELTPELTTIGMPHDCEDLLDLMIGYWGSEIPRLTKISLQFNHRPRALRAVKRLLEVAGSSLQVFESHGRHQMREWSLTHIHQSLNMFDYLVYSTQHKSNKLSLFSLSYARF